MSSLHHHHHSIVLLSRSHVRDNAGDTSKITKAPTLVQLLFQDQRLPTHLSQIVPACPHVIDAPDAASGLGPHIIVLYTPRTSPGFSLNDACARDTAPVSRCARRCSGVAASMVVRDWARRIIVPTYVVARVLLRRGD